MIVPFCAGEDGRVGGQTTKIARVISTGVASQKARNGTHAPSPGRWDFERKAFPTRVEDT
jgi:hypothetical protein